MGTGTGKTAGRGTKGQKSRSGHHMMPARFEGGQMPLTQRIPKLRGFRNPVSHRSVGISTSQLAALGGKTVDLETLRAAGLVDRQARRVKLVAGAKPQVAYSVNIDAVTAGAKKLIESAGGTVKVTNPPADA
jgi:large subunit ribosomal protein L15